MPKKRTKLTVRKGSVHNKHSKYKERKSNTVVKSITLKNQYKDLQAQFKLKDLRIILYDITAQNTILPYQKPFISKNIESKKVTEKCKQYVKKQKKSSVNDVVKTKCSNVSPSPTMIEKNTSHEKIAEKHNSDEKIAEKHNSDEKITKKHNSDEKITKKHNSDERITKKHNSDAKITEKCNSDQKITEKCNSDEKITEKCNSDEKITEKCNSDETIIEKCNSDKKITEKCNSDKKITEKCNSDEKITENCNSDEKITEKCNSDEKITEKCNSDKKITEKQKTDNNFHINTKLLNTEKQKTCSRRCTKLRSNPTIKNNTKKKKFKLTHESGCMVKHENTDVPIAATNCSRNLYPDPVKKKVLASNIHIKKNIRKKNINSDVSSGQVFITNKHLTKDKCLIVQTDEKSPEEMQAKLTVIKKQLPHIIEDAVLPKNTVLLKTQDNMQMSNNLQDTASSTTAVVEKKTNECSLTEECNRVVDLTVNNLHEFTQNYNECPVSIENVILLNTTESLKNSMNGNSINMILKTEKDDLYVSPRRRRRRRSWIMQKEETILDNPGIKRIKLDRKCIQENNCSTNNSSMSVCPSYDQNTNVSSKCNNINIDNNTIQDMDNHLTLYSNNGNALCTIQFVQDSTKADCDDTLRSTHAVAKTISNTSNTIFTGECERNELLSTTKCQLNTESIDKKTLNGSEKLSCNTQPNPEKQVENETNDNNDDDDDVISLYAGSIESVDEVIAPLNKKEAQNTNYDYKMTGNTFNNYVQQNIVECNKALDSIEGDATFKNERRPESYQTKYEKIGQNSILPVEKPSINVGSISSVNSNVVNNNNSLCSDKNINKCKENIVCSDKAVVIHTEEKQTILYEKLYKGYCFSKLRHGECTRAKCYFTHNLQILFRVIIFNYKQYLTGIMEYTYSMKFYSFLRLLYIQTVEEFNVTFIIDLYQKLYSKKYADVEVVYAAAKVLVRKGMHPKDVVESLVKTVTSTDNSTPCFILDAIKNEIEIGEYWNTLRSLFMHIIPNKEIVESILNNCVITHEHVQDVHQNLIKRLNPMEKNQLNKDIMLSFNNLLEHENQERESNNMSSNLETNNEEPCKDSYTLHSISNLPEPHSEYRDRFWKLYLMLYNIKEALLHEDYDYVVSILNTYQENMEDESLFSRCCFQILCAEIKHSEYHITKIIEHAVQVGASSILYKLLLDVATYVLMKLITEEAWILAYKLLKSLQVYNLQHSAALTILSAEIYLANKHAIKALMLLKQSNIICINRNNWNVASNAEDYYLRTNIIRILLDVLCIESPEHAFFVFQFLTKDQANNFQPIDLTHYVDKLMAKFLIERKIELIIKLGYMIIEYNFTFDNTTICRAAIATIVHSDMTLAKQLYQYACGLGIYRTIELLPLTRVIINVDWVEEEIYLTFWDLFQRLVIEIGHSIDHFNPNTLAIYIIFEAVPTEARLYYENFYDQQVQKLNVSKNLVRQVLRTRFEPSIPFSKKGNGAIMKLQNKAVIDHLKSISKN